MQPGEFLQIDLLATDQLGNSREAIWSVEAPSQDPVSQSVSRLACWSVRRLVSWPVSQLVSPSVGQWVGGSTSQSHYVYF